MGVESGTPNSTVWARTRNLRMPSNKNGIFWIKDEAEYLCFQQIAPASFTRGYGAWRISAEELFQVGHFL